MGESHNRVPMDPAINPETAAYWQAAQDSALMIGHCDDCSQLHHYPRAVCPHCLSGKVSLIPAKGTGRIYSVSVMRRGVPEPYAIAYVTLDEGVSVLTNIVNADLDALAIDQVVKLIFIATHGGQNVPMFTTV